MRLFDDECHWVQVKDGNEIALSIFKRHYSKYHYKDGRNPKLFAGPGKKVVLLSKNDDALFVWRKFISSDGQQGVNCAVFRNESKILSSLLIDQAERIASNLWPGERFYTYVNPKKVKSSNPGYCFKVNGWKQCGVTKKRKLIILEKFFTDKQSTMTQEQKDKALAVLAACVVASNIVRLPEEEIDFEIWTVVKDALEAVGGKYRKTSKTFVFNPYDDHLEKAAAWLKDQPVVSYDAPVVYDGPVTVDAEEIPNEEGEPKKDDITFKKEKRTLRYDFTAQETHELALKLAEENRKLAAVEEEQSSISAQYGARKKMIKASLNELSLLITNGYEHRDVEVEVHYNKPTPGKKTILRTDTNTSTVEKMEPWEFNLFNQPEDDDFALVSEERNG